MPGNVLDSGDAVADNTEKIPVLIELIVNGSLICINILLAYMVQRQEILFQNCRNFHFTQDDWGFIYDKV